MDTAITQKLKTYAPSTQAIELITQTPVVVLVGPTGAGKDSLKDRLMLTGRYHHIVSHTTRPPRINHGITEQDGREYHFIDQATAERMLDNHEFIEAKVYSGNVYGTSVSEIAQAKTEGKIAMTDIEVQGVAEYKQIDPNVVAIFLLPPNFAVWQARLQRRYGDVTDVADYRYRLQTGLDELDQLLNTDHYIPLINDDLDETVQQVAEIVASATHTSPHAEQAQQVATELAQDIRGYLAASS